MTMMEEDTTIPNILSENEMSSILEGEYENVSLPLTDWQRSILHENMTTVGIQCLIYMWFTIQSKLQPGTYCNATWDNFYCWPPTLNGETISRPCSEILKNSILKYSIQHFKGQATRVCSENSTWLWGNWTNYTECADSLDEYEKQDAAENDENFRLVVEVRYILFIGSVLSFVCLVTSLFIFYYFKCLRCDRVTVHVHLMIALTLRCILLVVITEPFIFHREQHYRNVNAVCKTVLSMNLFATVTSILWMFLQGVYLHGKLTTNVFDKGTPFKIYYAVGWGLPLILILGWATVMEIHYKVDCWRNYSDLPYIWILLAPMILALVGNVLFLINIMRILLTKIQRSNNSGDAAQFRRAVKATVVLFPLLGINNLLFIYNPGGQYQRTFVILNTVFQSTQGIFVSILYCFVSSDVRDAIRRQYRRFAARRSANSVRRNTHGNRSSKYLNGNYRTTSTTGQQDAVFAPPIYFRSKFKSNRSLQSKSPSPEAIINNPSPILVNVGVEGSNLPSSTNNNPRNTSLLASQVIHLTSFCNKNNKTLSENGYDVSVPLKDLNILNI